MTDIKLLTLPAEIRARDFKWTAVEVYAIANVLHHTAPLQYALDNAARSIKSLRGVMDSYAAEIEALRAEVRTLVRQNGELQARAERLQEEIDNRWATGVHTCHAACQRTACVLRRDNERLAEALWEAEKSLRTIADCAGLTKHIENASDVRGYANSRANAARAALEQEANDGR